MTYHSKQSNDGSWYLFLLGKQKKNNQSPPEDKNPPSLNLSEQFLLMTKLLDYNLCSKFHYDLSQNHINSYVDLSMYIRKFVSLKLYSF